MFVCSSVRLQSLCSTTVNVANLASSRHFSLSLSLFLSLFHTQTHTHTHAYATFLVNPPSPYKLQLEAQKSAPIKRVIRHQAELPI